MEHSWKTPAHDVGRFWKKKIPATTIEIVLYIYGIEDRHEMNHIELKKREDSKQEM